jgi:hypothetical protein
MTTSRAKPPRMLILTPATSRTPMKSRPTTRWTHLSARPPSPFRRPTPAQAHC